MSRHSHIALAILEKRKAAKVEPEADITDELLADEILGDELFDEEDTDEETADPKESRREMLNSIMKSLRVKDIAP